MLRKDLDESNNKINCKERKTRIANKILESMLIKYCKGKIAKNTFNTYFAVLNAAHSAYYARRISGNGSDYDEFATGEKVTDDDLVVRIKYKQLKKLALNKNVTKKEFDDITDSINLLVPVGEYEKINLFKSLVHCDDEQVLEVTFIKEYFELALLIVENSTLINMSVLKCLSNKYEYYVYIKYCEFKCTGKVVCPIDKLRENLRLDTKRKEFDSKGNEKEVYKFKTKDITKKLDEAINNINLIEGIDIKRNVYKNGRNITHYVFTFKPWDFI